LGIYGLDIQKYFGGRHELILENLSNYHFLGVHDKNGSYLELHIYAPDDLNNLGGPTGAS